MNSDHIPKAGRSDLVYWSEFPTTYTPPHHQSGCGWAFSSRLSFTARWHLVKLRFVNDNISWSKECRLTEKSLRAAGLASSAAAAGSLLAASLEPAVVDTPTRLTGMTTVEGVLAPVLDLAESDVVDDVCCWLSSPATIRSLAIYTHRQQPQYYLLKLSGPLHIYAVA